MIYGIAFMVVFFLVSITVLNFSSVQTFLGQWAASRMSKSLETEVRIDKIDIDFFNKVSLNGFITYDQQGDTLMYAKLIDLSILNLGWRNNAYRFGDLILDGASFNLTVDESGESNFQFIRSFFAPEKTDTITDIDMFLRANNFELIDCSFSYRNYAQPDTMKGLALNDLDIYAINGSIGDFRFRDDSMSASLNSFSLMDKSGFSLSRVSGDIMIGPTGIWADDFELKTPASFIQGNIALMHSTWSDYNDFVNAVEWDSEFRESKISLSDIGYFAPVLLNKNIPFYLTGDITGTISDLKGRDVVLRATDKSVLRGNFDINGLPDAANSFIDVRIKMLNFNYADLLEIGNRFVEDQNTDVLIPAELQRAGDMRFNGSFTGFPQDFVAYGRLSTDVGAIDLDLNLENDTINNRLAYKGRIETEGLNLGRLLEVEDLGAVSASAEVMAYSRDELLSATIEGVISELTFKKYKYTNIELDGTVSKNRFNGFLMSRDRNFNLDFEGLVDMSERKPQFNFVADVFNVDLTALNLIDYPETISFSSYITLNADGNTLNSFNGTLLADDSYICRGDSMAFLDAVQLSALGDTDNRKISLTSDVADVNITGAFNIELLPKSFLSLISEVLPSLVQQQYIAEREEFDFNINYKAGGVISRTLFPGLTIAPNSTAFGSYNSTNRTFGLYVKSDFLKYGDFGFHDINIDAGKISEVLKSRIYASEVSYKSFEIENLDADIEAYADIAEIGLGWFNEDESSQGELEGRLILIDRNMMEIRLQPGYIGRDQTIWKLNEETVVNIDTTHLCIDNFAITHRDQELRVFGCISEDEDEQLNLEMSRFSIAAVDTLLGGALSNIGGIINLEANVRDFYDDRIIRANGSLTGLTYKGYEIGDISATSNYVGEGKKLDIKGDLTVSDQELIGFRGDYNIGEEEPLEGELLLSDFDLSVLNAFNIPEVKDFTGKANGEIAVKGDFDKPLVDGFIDFDQARFRVEYLNAFFEFSDRVRVEEDWFGIDYKPIYDSRGQKGRVVASAFHENYANWNYDIFATVNNFYLMNTTREDNSTYFGTAYASGELQLGGYQGFLEINIDAETEEGTVIKLPLDDSEEVTLENFVYFVDNKQEEETAERDADLSGVQLRLNIDATPDAEAQIIFDEQTGDILRGRGSGKLTFEISPSGEFLMFGRYEIEEGDYLFTLKNLINKRFTLRKGGIIGWYGDPYQADVDMSASYLVRAPLYPIMVENQEVYRSREDIRVVLRLQEKLMNPTINFSIELPQATETERSQLASVVSTTQQLNQQVFALLILNRFLPIAAADQQNQAASGMGGLGSATTSDFVSTQISNWLSEISNDFDIGVNYRPGDQISNQEIAVALSTQLFNERLTVRGNFGVTSASETQYTQGRSGILGDFLMEYALTEEGKIRLKVFNETNPYEVFSTSSSIYTQGVGLIYQEDFDTLDEFMDEVKGLFTNDKAEKAPQP